jgi:HEAT repeat protein
VKERFRSVFKVHTGETQLVSMLGGMMLLAAAGSAIGGASIDALFFARFGVATLPEWYVVLGIVNFLNLVFMAGLIGRVARARLYLVLPAVLASLLVLARLLLQLNLHWTYPTLYIGKEVINSLAGVFLWGLASNLLDARQAKRLFPLFTAGAIAGALVGSFGTPVLVSAFGAENMLLVWSLALAGTGVLCQALIRQHRAILSAHAASNRRSSPGKSGSAIAALFTEIREGYRYVRRSSLLRLFSVAAVLFSICWFSLLLPFSRLSAQHFPDANTLASFFGLFQGLVTSLALLISLFLASRLFNRFGLINMLAVYPLIYFSAFAILAIFTAFPLLVFSMFIKLIWGQGVVDTAWQAVFNAVPGKRRDQARAFINAVPGQFGIILSGLILIIGEKTLRPQQLFWIGLVAAAACFWTVWRTKNAYTGALTDALRSGEPHVFFAEEEPFGGFQRDPAAFQVLVEGLADPDAGRRRLSAQILGRISSPQSTQALLSGLKDPDPEVRAACLASLQENSQPTSEEILAGVTASLADPHLDVRRQAVSAVQAVAGHDPDRLAPLQLILQDPDATVRAQAAAGLAQAGLSHPALDVLSGMASDPDPQVRVEALKALGGCNPTSSMLLTKGLADPDARVRKASLDGLACPPEELVEEIVQMLGDVDSLVRASAASALGRIGEQALNDVINALDIPALESGALHALEILPVQAVRTSLREYIHRKITRALGDFNLKEAFPVNGNERIELLVDALEGRSKNQALLALHAFGLLGNKQAITLALEGLQSRDPVQNAFALETLEAGEESTMIRPLLRLWESGERIQPAVKIPIMQLLDDPDAWLRACTAFVACESNDPEVAARLSYLAQSDPDELVRLTAASVLNGELTMETLPTLTTMERILFLRKVPLFKGLPPVDLKQVAAIGIERLYLDGEAIVHQGDLGDELFIIISGQVRVVTDTGRELAIRSPGEYVGEMALLDQAPRSATLLAQGDVRLLCVGQEDFEAILRQRPEVSLVVINVLSARLRQLST